MPGPANANAPRQPTREPRDWRGLSKTPKNIKHCVTLMTGRFPWSTLNMAETERAKILIYANYHLGRDSIRFPFIFNFDAQANAIVNQIILLDSSL